MKKYRLILTVVFISIIFSYLFVFILSRKLNPEILKYSEVEAKRFASNIINTSIIEVTNSKDLNNLISVSKNKYDEIEEVSFNTNNVNILLKEVTENLQKKILALEEGKTTNIEISSSLRGNSFKHKRKGIVNEIPMGSVYGNSILANTGPIIPVKLTFIGKVYSKINTKIKSYGINNSYIEVDIEVAVSERVSIPSLTKDFLVTKEIPITMKIIQGKIPEYYGKGLENSYDYILPLK